MIPGGVPNVAFLGALASSRLFVVTGRNSVSRANVLVGCMTTLVIAWLRCLTLPM